MRNTLGRFLGGSIIGLGGAPTEGGVFEAKVVFLKFYKICEYIFIDS